MSSRRKDRSHADIIRLWDTLQAFASDMDEDRECVRAWRDRDSIPSHAFNQVVRASDKRGFGVTLEELADAAETRRKPHRPDAEGMLRVA